MQANGSTICAFSQATLYKTVTGSVTQVASVYLACQMQYIAVTAPDGSLRLGVQSDTLTPGVPPYTEPIIWTDPGTKLVGKPGFGLARPSSGTADSVDDQQGVGVYEYS